MELREEVRQFGELMEERLRENDHKGGWQDESAGWLLGRLLQEVRELEIVLSQRVSLDPDVFKQLVAHEAADVANFAMFICDVCGGFEWSP